MGKKDDDNIVAMEMESLKPSSANPTKQSINNKPSVFVTFSNQLCAFIKLWMEMNPCISSILVFSIVGFSLYGMFEYFRPDVHRHSVQKDYSELELNYTIKAADIKSWCLFGNDDKCNCQDFTNPQSRLFDQKWTDAYRYNIKQVKDVVNDQKQLDVVFVGDEMVQGMMGRGSKSVSGEIETHTDRIKTAQLFNRTFRRDDGGAGDAFEGMALGIGGDATANLIWRLKHGEMDRNLQPYVWWIWIGTHDLGKGGCSEAATTLGILRTAEELHYHDPEADIVIMGVLPRAERTGGKLNAPKSHGFSFLSSKHAKTIKDAYNRESLWPSIQNVNKELRDFCKNHPKIVYFDAHELFLGSMGNSHFHDKTEDLIPTLMPDYVHPSYRGYSVLIKAIKRELKRILYDNNEENDVETGEDDDAE